MDLRSTKHDDAEPGPRPELASFTFTPLTPVSFLERSAVVYRDRVAIVDGAFECTYGELLDRSARLAGALAELGVEPGDRVAALCSNGHVMLELHHGVPMSGAVLVPLNIRLSVDELTHIVEHSHPHVLVVTADLAPTARELAKRTDVVVVVAGTDGRYEECLDAAERLVRPCDDERSLLAINYTSGTTTGRPKGVMYHHRGAYLQSLAMALHTGLRSSSRYLWTLPMFHCDGWCFPWAATAAGATHVCVPRVDPTVIWRLIRTDGVTHLSAAPTVLAMLADAPEAAAGPLEEVLHVQTGGAPPSPTLLERLATLNVSVTHLYGLTETFGPIAVNEWQPQWDRLEASDRALRQARQGVGNVVAQPLRVVDAQGVDVPADGSSVGEIVCRGNDVMLGYYRDDAATEAVTLDGWFRTGDLAVMHSDGYVEIRDRAKDVIISGGENIASVEVERCLDQHPAVLESAVVGRPHERWGEVPVAFVALRSGQDVSEHDLIEFVRARLAHFKAPHEVYFDALPKTSTGKIQKHVLRASLRA